MSRKLHVNMVSETLFTVRGHGVHSAFIETTQALRHTKLANVVVNKFRQPAHITHIQTMGFYALTHLLFGPGKKVISAHLVPDSFVGSLVGAHQWYPIARWYLRFFYNRADVLLAVSDSVRDVLQDDLGVKPPITVLYNAIDTSRYTTTPALRRAARKKLGIKAKDFVVMGSGQIQPRKRFDVFIKTAQALPQLHFLWVGGIPFKKLGADYHDLKRMIDTAPPNVRVTGVVNHNDMVHYYRAADVFFFPSAQETFGLVVVEAAAAGLPVIVRDITDYNATFKNNVLRVKEAAFVQTIQDLKNKPDFYSQAQAKSAALAAQYDSQQFANRLMGEYRQLLDWDNTKV